MAGTKFSHSGRDAWGQTHGNSAGKGDKARHKFNANFRRNFDAIKWGPKSKGKFRKVYGPRRPVSFTELADIPPTFSGNSDR